jgi:hypothetical protein
LRVGEYQDRPLVEVAYGTSQKVDSLYSGEFAILQSDRAAYEAAGLSYPTKFNLAETFELDYNDTWFDVAPGAPYGQDPRLGVLHPSLVRRVEAAVRAAGSRKRESTGRT